MSKPRGNCVFIEYRGVSEIYFDRDQDKFLVVVERASSTPRKTLAQARAFADTHGDPKLAEDLGLLVAVEQHTFDVNNKHEAVWRLATLVAFDRYSNVRVRYADGSVDLTWRDVCVVNGQEDVDRLNELLDAEKRAAKQYKAYQKLRKCPETLEEVEKAVAAQKRAQRRAAK